MSRNPGGDIAAPAVASTELSWSTVLAHRGRDGEEAVSATARRFEVAGVTPAQVASHLEDGGDRLFAAAASGASDWARAFGGEHAAALLAAEVSTLMSHLVARAASVRAVCVDTLLDELSAVTVAGALGVARQKVYGLARAEVDRDYITTAPWRTS